MSAMLHSVIYQKGNTCH